MMDWLADPVILRYGRAVTSGNDLAVSWAAIMVGILYFPLVRRAIKRRLSGRPNPPNQMLFVGIFLTACGISMLRLYWSIYRAVEDKELKDTLLWVGDYTSSIIALSLLGYMIHLHTIWHISGKSRRSYVCLVISMICVFGLGFWNTMRS